MPNPLHDRLAALRAMSTEDIAWLLRRLPAVAEALSGTGPLVGSPSVVRSEEPSLQRLAELLSGRAGIHAALTSLNQVELRLVTLARWYGGRLTRGQARREAGGSNDQALDDAADTIGRLLLSDPQGWLVLRPGVSDGIGLPGVPVRPSLQHMQASEVGRLLAALGVRAKSPRKRDRVDQLEVSLRDRELTVPLIRALPEEARRIFWLLAEHGPQRVRDLGIARFNPWYYNDTALDALVDAGLAGVDVDEQVSWVWLDVIVGLSGRLYVDWTFTPPQVACRPVAEMGALPATVARFDALLGTWAARPAPALAAGGLGVRPVRAAAKELGLPPGEVGLLAHLAIGMGLLGSVETPAKGGRRAAPPTLTWAPTIAFEDWRQLPAAQRWALLVQAWTDDRYLLEDDGLPERVEPSQYPRSIRELSRSALLGLLGQLPKGQGVAEDDLATLAGFERPALFSGSMLDGLLAAARVLGLVPAEGPVGLTRLGRALLEGPDALQAALPPPRSEFIVQADQTVIAPPDLAPVVAERLERYAELESAAGARTYRLSQRRLTLAFESDETADEILEFLRVHSTVEVAQNVTYLITDLARRHGRVRAGGCSSYVRCDDSALLSSAATVKGAKLRVLAPTVAVSPLSPDKLVTALRDRGVMAVAEDADGVTIRPTRQFADTVPILTAGAALTLRPRASDAEAAALAKRLLGPATADVLSLDLHRR